MRFNALILLIVILLLSGCSQLPEIPSSVSPAGNYYVAMNGNFFADPGDSFSLSQSQVICSDKEDISISMSVTGYDLVYDKGYLWDKNTQNWLAFDLTGNRFGNDWIAGDAKYELKDSCSTLIDTSDNGAHYIVVYGCNREKGRGNCKNSKWLLQSFDIEPIRRTCKDNGTVVTVSKGDTLTYFEDECATNTNFKDYSCQDTEVIVTHRDCFSCFDDVCDAQSELSKKTEETSLFDQRRTVQANDFIRTPVYRLFSSSAINHFYTTSGAERANAETLGYTYETILGHVFTQSYNTFDPIYRMYNEYANDHFYTASEDEKNQAQNFGWVFENILGYASLEPLDSFIPIYRLFHPEYVNHFYTASLSERDTAINLYGYLDEGILAYFPTEDIPDTNPSSIKLNSEKVEEIKLMYWNINGEVLLYGDRKEGIENWYDIPATVNKIGDIILDENPDVVALNPIHDDFKRQLVDKMNSLGYSYQYLQSHNNLIDGIFSKYPLKNTRYVSTQGWPAYPPGGPQTPDNYAGFDTNIFAEITVLGMDYIFVLGSVPPGARQNKLNHEYFQENLYRPIIKQDKPHFIVGDFNLYLSADGDRQWYENEVPQTKFYNNFYKDVCQEYLDPTCYDSVANIPLHDGPGRLDHIIYRDFSSKRSIYLKHAHIRQDINQGLDVSDHFPIISTFIISKEQIVPGDFDGDGQEEIALYDDSSGLWNIYDRDGSILNSQISHGYSGSIGLSGDYDGDGKDDLMVYGQCAHDGSNPNLNCWYGLSLDRLNMPYGIEHGFSKTIPKSGDYDGDGKSDLLVYSPISNMWWSIDSKGDPLGYGIQWGFKESLVPVSGDFNNDGKDDLTLYDNQYGAWWTRNSIIPDVYLWNESWGGDGLLAFPGDINNDGHDDLNVYHLAEQKVYSRTKEGELLLWAEPYNIPAIFVSENPSYINGNLEIAYLNTDTQEIGFLEIS